MQHHLCSCRLPSNPLFVLSTCLQQIPALAQTRFRWPPLQVSLKNEGEARAVVAACAALLRQNCAPRDIAVITPYKAQQHEIRARQGDSSNSAQGLFWLSFMFVGLSLRAHKRHKFQHLDLSHCIPIAYGNAVISQSHRRGLARAPIKRFRRL